MFHGKFWINDEQTGRSVYFYDYANIHIHNTGCCFCSVVKLYLTPCDPMVAASQASLSSTISQSLLKFMSIESVMLSDHFNLCCPFLFCLTSFPASGSFQISWFFTLGGQRIGASVSESVLAMNIQGWFPLGLISLLYLKSKRFSKVFSSTTIQKHQYFSSFYGSTLTSIHDTGKTTALTIWTFVGKGMSLLFNMLSNFVIAFLPRNKCL